MRTFKITVNGVVYNVTVEESNGTAPVQIPVQAPVQAPVQTPVQAPVQTPVQTPAQPPVQNAAPAPAATSAPGEGDPVKAPMPGTIVKICVKSGDSVKSGDVVCIIEAMKMENEIVAPKDGTVTSVTVSSGASVNSGDVLLTIA